MPEISSLEEKRDTDQRDHYGTLGPAANAAPELMPNTATATANNDQESSGESVWSLCLPERGYSDFECHLVTFSFVTDPLNLFLNSKLVKARQR